MSISSQSSTSSTPDRDEIRAELKARQATARVTAALWVQRAGVLYFKAQDAENNADAKTAAHLRRRAGKAQQNAQQCWSAIAKLQTRLCKLDGKPIPDERIAAEYAGSNERGLNVGEQIDRAVEDLEHKTFVDRIENAIHNLERGE